MKNIFSRCGRIPARQHYIKAGGSQQRILPVKDNPLFCAKSRNYQGTAANKNKKKGVVKRFFLHSEKNLLNMNI
ncbi:hypothetical protein KKC83_03250 [Patescibacteria group bacterium]|nr:hypothetical protein [Candidatus Falkowbacteria bacterium]MBU3905636.1 hypothetical protein [Patescibacteria group bacterium]MBU4015506.1 hypothetical protein [Patescibacteria group bacterium]MBU4026530.1 hypothetical protein [Patescibacteria group bacterium]MBU4073168.1 hypothetical protein [Patescibacteria group bacterium]